MASPPPKDDLSIPIYTIDLSLPPHLRYIHLARDFAPKMLALTLVFDDILNSISPSPRMRRFIKFLCSVLLFRVYSREETIEIRGIAKVSGLKMYLLVAMNILLDSRLGCTSGGDVVTPKETRRKGKGKGGVEEGRMMHFRTLDWGMDELRDILVVLEFIQSKSEEPEKVIARTVTYAGFVGV